MDYDKMDYGLRFRILRDKGQENLTEIEVFELKCLEILIRNDLEMYKKMHEHCVANGAVIPDYLPREIDYLTGLLDSNNLSR